MRMQFIIKTRQRYSKWYDNEQSGMERRTSALDCWFWCKMFEHMLHIEYDAVVDYANSSSNQWICCWHSLSFSVHCTYVFISMFPGHNPLAMCTELGTEELIVFGFLFFVVCTAWTRHAATKSFSVHRWTTLTASVVQPARVNIILPLLYIFCVMFCSI